MHPGTQPGHAWLVVTTCLSHNAIRRSFCPTYRGRLHVSDTPAESGNPTRAIRVQKAAVGLPVTVDSSSNNDRSAAFDGRAVSRCLAARRRRRPEPGTGTEHGAGRKGRRRWCSAHGEGERGRRPARKILSPPYVAVTVWLPTLTFSEGRGGSPIDQDELGGSQDLAALLERDTSRRRSRARRTDIKCRRERHRLARRCFGERGSCDRLDRGDDRVLGAAARGESSHRPRRTP